MSSEKERAASVNRVVVYEEEGADPRVDLLDVRTVRGRTRVRTVDAADDDVELRTRARAVGAADDDVDLGTRVRAVSAADDDVELRTRARAVGAADDDVELRTRVRAVGAADDVVELVSGLIASGVDAIELCGGFGALWHARVAAAAGDVPVGAVYFGFESLTAVASYKARFEAGEVLSEAFIIRHPGADPHQDRAVRTKPGGGRTTIVAAPDDTVAAQLAADLSPDLIELYGVPSPASAAPLIEAVNAKIPVGATAHPT